MKTFKKYIFIALLVPLFTGVNHALSIELSKGVLQEFGMSFTAEQRLALPKVTKTIDAFESTGDVMSLAFVNVSGTDEWYRLFDNIKLYGVNVKEEKLLGAWPLTPWAYLTPPSELIARAEEYDTIVDDFASGGAYPVGCLSQSLLNYGDFDADQKNELILFLGNTLTVFSPDYGRTIFSIWLSLNDWFTAEDSLEYYLEEDFSVNKKPENPQYESRIAHKRYYQSVHVPGYRGYSKIYIDDFNKDGNTDILLWKKIYLSKLERDPQRGFDLVRDEFAHYSRDLTAQQKSEAGVTCEYLPQDTRPETIQGWLSAKDLTWQKGFPSKSECAGEEGELIPEMHDVLLNDPDVLK